MSNGAPAATSAERSEPPTYENKITYQKCSVFPYFCYRSWQG